MLSESYDDIRQASIDKAKDILDELKLNSITKEEAQKKLDEIISQVDFYDALGGIDDKDSLKEILKSSIRRIKERVEQVY